MKGWILTHSLLYGTELLELLAESILVRVPGEASAIDKLVAE